MRIYLAGPEVFRRDAAQLGLAKKMLCARFHYTGMFPLDGTPPQATPPQATPPQATPSDTPPPDGATIYASCLAMMRIADCGIFNLTPFRGASADAGTVYELGFMAALGKPAFGYTHAAEDLIDRLRASPGLAFDEATQQWRDPLGMSAEDFGNADNLMIDEAFAAQGRKIHRLALPEAERFTRLEGFFACLREVRAFFTARREG